MGEPNGHPDPTRPRPGALLGFLVFAVPMLILVSPILIVYILWDSYRTATLRREFSRRRPGKLGLLVYSNSPHWQTYIEQHWLPAVGDRLIVLNWSHRATWKVEHPFEERVFRRFAGDREFNPLAVVFKPRRRFARLRAWLRGIRNGDVVAMFAPSPNHTEVVRFFQAFRDYRHGKEQLLRKNERRMFDALSASDPAR